MSGHFWNCSSKSHTQFGSNEQCRSELHSIWRVERARALASITRHRTGLFRSRMEVGICIPTYILIMQSEYGMGRWTRRLPPVCRSDANRHVGALRTDHPPPTEFEHIPTDQEFRRRPRHNYDERGDSAREDTPTRLDLAREMEGHSDGPPTRERSRVPTWAAHAREGGPTPWWPRRRADQRARGRE